MSKEIDEQEMAEYIAACEMLVEDTTAELYNIEDTYKADLRLLTVHFFRQVAADLNLNISIGD